MIYIMDTRDESMKDIDYWFNVSHWLVKFLIILFTSTYLKMKCNSNVVNECKYIGWIIIHQLIILFEYYEWLMSFDW